MDPYLYKHEKAFVFTGVADSVLLGLPPGSVFVHFPKCTYLNLFVSRLSANAWNCAKDIT